MDHGDHRRIDRGGLGGAALNARVAPGLLHRAGQDRLEVALISEVGEPHQQEQHDGCDERELDQRRAAAVGAQALKATDHCVIRSMATRCAIDLNAAVSAVVLDAVNTWPGEAQYEMSALAAVPSATT